MPLRRLTNDDRERLQRASGALHYVLSQTGGPTDVAIHRTMRDVWNLLSELGVDARCVSCGRVGVNCDCPPVSP